jgi:hypothetical protein
MSKAGKFLFNIIRQIKTLVIVFLPMLGVYIKSNAQEISAKASAPKYEYLIGDKISVALDIKRPNNYLYHWNRQYPEAGKLELADSVKIDSFVEGRFIHTIIHLPLEGFDSGNIVYPEQVFLFYKDSDTTRFILKTQPLTFHIITISVDMNKDIKPIAEPVSPGLNWLKIFGYVMLYLLILGVIFLVIFLYVRNRRKERRALPQQPFIRRPPWEIAIESLLELRKTDLPGTGDVKGYYISLSAIIRQLVSDMYKMEAMELTTDEVIQKLHDKFIGHSNIDLLSGILNLADSVKFAKYIPNQSDHDKAMEDSFAFIQNVRDSKMEVSQETL